MATLEELRKTWDGKQNSFSISRSFDQISLNKIFKSRMKKNNKAIIKYFWSSFTLQIIVYALLSHVIVKYWSDTEIVVLCIIGALLYLPFTVMLLKEFKAIAHRAPMNQTGTSLYQYVLQHQTLLLSFYRFKKRYEFVLIPLSCAIGTILTFNLYMPGGVYYHLTGAGSVFILALVSCAVAIRTENKKSFDQPLQHIQEILTEFKNEL